MVIYVRRAVLRASKALRDDGILPANVDNPSLDRVRSASILLKETDDWAAATEDARNAAKGVLSYVTPL
jgi:hypothetical protein